jgi:hypothetical protein
MPDLIALFYLKAVLGASLFTPGRVIFTLVFLFVFIGVIFYSYRKDLKISRIHFRGTFWILFSIILIFSALFLIVKLRHG